MNDSGLPTDKASWRRALLAARAATPSTQRAAEAGALAAALGRLELPSVVCAHVPFGAEPGSTAMLDKLLARGSRVLLPVVRPGEALGWAEYRDAQSLVEGAYGIPTPAAAARPASAIADAGLVLVPALAVDRAGVRLGRGAGFYDRSLGFADPAARLVALVRDEEVVQRLPVEPHDVLMGWALTPNRGLVPLGRE